MRFSKMVYIKLKLLLLLPLLNPGFGAERRKRNDDLYQSHIYSHYLQREGRFLYNDENQFNYAGGYNNKRDLNSPPYTEPYHEEPYHEKPYHEEPYHEEPYHEEPYHEVPTNFVTPLPSHPSHHPTPSSFHHPAPHSPTPASYNPTPSPYSPTPSPYSPSPAPYSPTPVPYSPTPAAYSPTPAPYSPTPAPFSPTPAPYSPVPAPYNPTPDPYSPHQSSAYAITPAPPAPYGVSPTPHPYSPAPGPYSPYSAYNPHSPVPHHYSQDHPEPKPHEYTSYQPTAHPSHLKQLNHPYPQYSYQPAYPDQYFHQNPYATPYQPHQLHQPLLHSSYPHQVEHNPLPVPHEVHPPPHLSVPVLHHQPQPHGSHGLVHHKPAIQLHPEDTQQLHLEAINEPQDPHNPPSPQEPEQLTHVAHPGFSPGRDLQIISHQNSFQHPQEQAHEAEPSFPFPQPSIPPTLPSIPPPQPTLAPSHSTFSPQPFFQALPLFPSPTPQPHLQPALHLEEEKEIERPRPTPVPIFAPTRPRQSKTFGSSAKNQIRGSAPVKMEKSAALQKLYDIAGDDWDSDETIQKSLSKQLTKFICPANEGNFPDPNSCEVYHQCAHGASTRYTCQAGLKWNVATDQCDWEANVDCSLNLRPGSGGSAIYRYYKY